MTYLGKTELSNEGSCPALYETDRNTFVLQGWEVTDKEALSFARDVAADETFVEVPADVLMIAFRRFLAAQDTAPEQEQ
jgi:hypothetical protein